MCRLTDKHIFLLKFGVSLTIAFTIWKMCGRWGVGAEALELMPRGPNNTFWIYYCPVPLNQLTCFLQLLTIEIPYEEGGLLKSGLLSLFTSKPRYSIRYWCWECQIILGRDSKLSSGSMSARIAVHVPLKLTNIKSLTVDITFILHTKLQMNIVVGYRKVRFYLGAFDPCPPWNRNRLCPSSKEAAPDGWYRGLLHLCKGFHWYPWKLW